jgi:N-acetylneuraminate synthase
MWFNGAPESCKIVAEVAQNHDGSLGTAHSYIDAVAKTGADAIKFQMHIASAESTPAEPWRVKFSRQDATRFDYWKRMQFTEEQWAGLAQHAQERGLLFLCSAFSNRAVEILDRLNVPAWKVGAGEITNLPMIDRMARTKRPVLLSSGLATWPDLDEAVARVRQHGAPVGVFQCTTAYPCPPERWGLNVIADLRRRYVCPVGLSDHSGTIYAGLAACALGLEMLEVHVVFSRECFGPDVPASVTTSELSQLVEGVRMIEIARANPIDKQAIAAELITARRTFEKSLIAARDLPAGYCLTEDDLELKKPGTGIPAGRFYEFVHRRLTRSVIAGCQLSEGDFEERTSA